MQNEEIRQLAESINSSSHHHSCSYISRSPVFPSFYQFIIPIFFCVLLLVFHSKLFPKYHPEISFREISNEQFIVVFPEGYYDEARYALNTAQQLYGQLTYLWGIRLPGRRKIRILISDVSDDSNGSATFFPYNQIEIALFTPTPDSTIGSSKDWIRLVLAHELTHIINLNAGSGFTYFMRRIFGSNPLLYPVIYVPGWILEGVAVFAESQASDGGRLNIPDYRLMLEYIARAGKIPNWGDFWGNPTSWPGNTSKYLYGAAFINFLAEKYGYHKIPELVKTFAYYPLPFTFTHGLEPRILNIHQRFKRVFEKDTRELWEEFLQHFKTTIRENVKKPIDQENLIHLENPEQSGTCNYQENKVTLLTREGRFKKYPIFTANEKIFYVNLNYKEYPGIFVMDIKNRKSRRLLQKSGINGIYYSPLDHKIYFSAADNFKAFYQYSDIYSLDLKTMTVKRLTRGCRLSYPTGFPSEKNKIYCIKRLKTRSYLAALDLKTQESHIISEGFDSLAYIAASPDNRYIAASLKRRGQQWAIALFTPDGQLQNVLTEGYGKCYYPVWKNSHELFFVIQYENNYCLASRNLNTNDFYIYDDHSIPAIRFFSLQPGKRDKRNNNVVASFFDSSGYNLGLMNLDNLEKKLETDIQADKVQLEKEELQNPSAISDPPQQYKHKSYNFLRDFSPKYISGYLRYIGNEFKPCLTMSGHDLSARNSFILETFYGFRSKKVNYIFNYTYDGFYPTLSLRCSYLSDFNNSYEYGDFIHDEKKLELQGFFPLWIKTRSQAYLYSNIHFETASDHFLEDSQENYVKLNGLKLGIFYNSAHRYYDSISNADGISFSLSYSREFKMMGSDYNINTAALQAKYYISLLRPNVLAVNLSVMDSWGEARRLFYMGGAKSKDGFHVAGDNLFDLMRGYPSGYFSGSGGYLLNIEYRISLFKIEKAFWISKSVDRLYLSLFVDIGHIGDKKWTLDPSYSLGMELNMMAFLGDMKFNIAGGIGFGKHPYHTPVVFLRIGNSF